jgi:hypothetical protein
MVGNLPLGQRVVGGRDAGRGGRGVTSGGLRDRPVGIRKQPDFLGSCSSPAPVQGRRAFSRLVLEIDNTVRSQGLPVAPPARADQERAVPRRARAARGPTLSRFFLSGVAYGPGGVGVGRG